MGLAYTSRTHQILQPVSLFEVWREGAPSNTTQPHHVIENRRNEPHSQRTQIIEKSCWSLYLVRRPVITQSPDDCSQLHWVLWSRYTMPILDCQHSDRLKKIRASRDKHCWSDVDIVARIQSSSLVNLRRGPWSSFMSNLSLIIHCEFAMALLLMEKNFLEAWKTSVCTQPRVSDSRIRVVCCIHYFSIVWCICKV